MYGILDPGKENHLYPQSGDRQGAAASNQAGEGKKRILFIGGGVAAIVRIFNPNTKKL